MQINIEQLLNGPRTSLRQRIADYFRREITAGTLAAGERLPTGREIATALGTSSINVHKALELLVAEGLITRQPHIGSVVNAVRRELRQVAVVIFARGVSGPSTFIQYLTMQIADALDKLGCQATIMTERKESPNWARLEEMVARREIQGIIPLTVNPEIFQKIRALPIPSAFLAESLCYARVYQSPTDLARLGVEALARQGCRRIGMISTMARLDPKREDFAARNRRRFYAEFACHAARYGLTTRPEWIQSMPPEEQDPAIRTPEWYATGGYAAFGKIWNSPERPDGLYVYTDDPAPGVLLAILSRRISVPRELKLALFRNRELPMLCPVSCAFVENSVADLAQALVSLLFRQFNGERVSPLRIPLRVVLPARVNRYGKSW